MTEYKYLTNINSPADLKALPVEALDALCEEIRAYLVETVSHTGGHLASNLGVVELTVALHRVFDAPEDRMIWDVGHQSYVHKLLTGRRERFNTLRTPGGLSGFTRREESESDPFGAGHSSTALSAALGFAKADRIAGRQNQTVAVIGDGAFSGGMVQEALNNCAGDLRLVAILNENEMSIGKTTGSFARYLAKIRSTSSYFRVKRGTVKVLHKIPLLGKPLHRMLLACKIWLKNLIYGSNYYEDLGLCYMGPIDGHDMDALIRALEEAKKKECSVLLHIKTKKGKGYAPAEESPDLFHSVYPAGHAEQTFHGVFGRVLTAEAEQDPTVVAVTAAMTEGTGLHDFADRYPDRFFDVGIAEEHAVTFAAGMAAAGMKPYAAIYSTFLQRAYDQILHDVALQRLPVRLCVDRAGLAASDGATHHGIFDVSFLFSIPSVRLYAPATFGSMEAMLEEMRTADGPCAIRYPNAGEKTELVEAFYPRRDYGAFGVRPDFEGEAPKDLLILTYGQIATEALAAEGQLRLEGLSVGTLLLETLAPYGAVAEQVLPYLSSTASVIFLEEGIRAGGAGMCLLDALTRLCPDVASRYRILAIDGHFAAPLEPCDLVSFCGISAADVVRVAKEMRKAEKSS